MMQANAAKRPLSTGSLYAMVAIALAVLATMTFAYDARGGAGSAFLDVPAPPEGLGLNSSTESDLAVIPLPKTVVNGERSTDLVADLRQSLEALGPVEVWRGGLLAELPLIYAEDVESNGVSFESAQLRGGSTILNVTRGPFVRPLPLYAIGPDNEVTTEVWPDGTQAAVRIENPGDAQLIAVKDGFVINLSAVGVGTLEDAPLTLAKLRLVVQQLLAVATTS